MVSVVHMESTVERSAVPLNGGVDCLVVKIALGGRFFAAQLSIKCGKREDCIGKHLSSCRQILANLLLSFPSVDFNEVSIISVQCYSLSTLCMFKGI